MIHQALQILSAVQGCNGLPVEAEAERETEVVMVTAGKGHNKACPSHSSSLLLLPLNHDDGSDAEISPSLSKYCQPYRCKT